MIRIIIVAAALLCALSAPARAHTIRAMVGMAALTAGVPENIAHAVIRQESGYNPYLRGAAGEWGLGQIKCQTARSVGFRGACRALADPATNLRFSFAYLKLALDRGGAGCAGVSLYQRGVYGRPSCSRYGRQVMARARTRA
jgi:soluble lytic murein transglycosylase-like protein